MHENPHPLARNPWPGDGQHCDVKHAVQSWARTKNFPERIILPTSRMIQNFRDEIGADVFEADGKELMMQVILALGSEDLTSHSDEVRRLPDLNRMRSTAVAKVDSFSDTIKRAVQRLALQLHQELITNKIYINGELDYFFDGFVGDDMVLVLVPY